MFVPFIEVGNKKGIGSAEWQLPIPERKSNSIEIEAWFSPYDNKRRKSINSSIIETLENKRESLVDNLILLKNQDFKKPISTSIEKSKDSRQKIFATLNNPAWDFWTVEAIAKETSLHVDEVKEIIASNSKIIRNSLVPDKKGRELYTLRSRSIKWKEYLALLRVLLAKSFF
jgi:hypothetical protein